MFRFAKVSFNSTINSLEEDFIRYPVETNTMSIMRAARMKGARTIIPEKLSIVINFILLYQEYVKQTRYGSLIE